MIIFAILFNQLMIRIMLSKKIEEAINAQINAEMWSAYLYLSMAAYCHLMGQTGMARWNEVQFKEEQDHAKILFNYVIQRNGKVTLSPIKAVPTEWKSLLDVFESILEHEQKITAMINNLFALSTEENAQTIIDNLNMIKDNGFGIFMLDKELGARVYAQAAPLANSTL